jgi:hypothetical protein
MIYLSDGHQQSRYFFVYHTAPRWTNVILEADIERQQQQSFTLTLCFICACDHFVAFMRDPGDLGSKR